MDAGALSVVTQQRVTWPDWVVPGRTLWLEVRWWGVGCLVPQGLQQWAMGGASVPMQDHEDALG